MEHLHTSGASAPVSTLAHSEEWFGSYRDFWWNGDFLDLMARRWQLSQYRTLLDVGCGRCHWSCLLAPRMAPGAQVTALDRDVKWAGGDDRVAAQFAQYGATVEFKLGDAQALPFDDDSFDVVTCQTVLMHLADPLAALREMRRVVRPGGIVICVEPCNLAQVGVANAISAEASIDALCDDFRYALLCERGKQAAGEGTLSLGDKLPRLFQLAGWSAIQSCLSDKVAPVLPPYDDEETRVNLAEALAMNDAARASLWARQVEGWVAALGDAEALDFVVRQHAQRTTQQLTLQSLIDNQTYWDGAAALTYLVYAVK